MSALNQSETEQLRAVKTILEGVLRNGFDPNAKDAKNLFYKNSLEQAKTAVHTITQMKGYYPK